MKNQKLIFKFTLMFVGFTLITLAVSLILSCLNQMQLYKAQHED